MQWRSDLEEGRCCRVRGSGIGVGVVGACTCHVIECSGASGIAPHDLVRLIVRLVRLVRLVGSLSRLE